MIASPGATASTHGIDLLVGPTPDHHCCSPVLQASAGACRSWPRGQSPSDLLMIDFITSLVPP